MSTSRNSKSKRPPSQIRGFLADNLLSLMNRVYADLPNVTARERALAAAAHTTPSQIQRVIGCTVGTSIDLVEQLSKPLGVRPQDLLTPYFAQSTGIYQRDGPPHAQKQEPEDATAGQTPAKASTSKRDARTQGERG